MNKNHKIYLFIYFTCLLLLAPISLPALDTYYYWDWSRHLDLSYYDGSPMIAYFIKASTLLFGDTLFALTLVGILSTALTSWIIYKTGRQFLSIPASTIATSIWLLSPLVTLNLLHQITYDNPLTLFWALTLYYVIRFLKYESLNDLYFIGLSIGLMLLSKYSGIVLIIGLLVFLITSRYRYLFKTHQFYIALFIAFVCFSPVIIWNYHFQWMSFIYQLNTHQLMTHSNPVTAIFHSLYSTFLSSLNFMLIPPFLCWLKIKDINKQLINDNQTTSIVKLCIIISIVFLCFYLFAASKAHIRGGWLTQYLITSALLCGYCYEHLFYRKSVKLVIILYAFLSSLVLLNNTYFYRFKVSEKLAYYRLMQQFNEKYKNIPDMVFTSGWVEARKLFFIKSKPLIYTLDCYENQNQYALWSADIAKKVENKALPEIIYIDDKERSACLTKYFDKCEQLPIEPEKKGKDMIPIFAYKCINYKINNTSIN